MGKKGKKFRWKSLPSACRTCIIGMIISVIVGIGLIIYGNVVGVSTSDIKTVQAEIVSIEQVDRNLSDSQMESLLENGTDENSVLYEFKIGYRYIIDGKDYQYVGRKHFDKGSKLSIGDMETLNYALVDGKIVIDPETESAYGAFGIAFIIAGLLAGIAAYILRPGNGSKGNGKNREK